MQEASDILLFCDTGCGCSPECRAYPVGCDTNEPHEPPVQLYAIHEFPDVPTFGLDNITLPLTERKNPEGYIVGNPKRCGLYCNVSTRYIIPRGSCTSPLLNRQITICRRYRPEIQSIQCAGSVKRHISHITCRPGIVCCARFKQVIWLIGGATPIGVVCGIKDIIFSVLRVHLLIIFNDFLFN